MIEEIRLAWTDRLRDHTQPQGTGQLWIPCSESTVVDAFDVWGHLCEVSIDMDAGLVVRDSDNHGYYDHATQRIHKRYPPDSVLKWADIDREAGPSSDIVLHLAARNDNESNFPFMAEEIDQYLG